MPELFIAGGPSAACYDAMHESVAPIRGDVAFYRRQARATGGPILEIACGTGRVSVPLARAGFDVTGLDLSPHMLAIARAKPGADRVRWVRGNMRRFSLGRRFRLILVPFRSFQRLLTVEAQRECLECIRRHLRPGGTLVLSLFDPRLDLCTPGPKVPEERSNALDPATGRVYDLLIHDRRNDPVSQTFTTTWDWTERVPRGHRARRWRYTLPMRWTYRWEMRHLLELSGFEPIACYGDYRGGPPRYGAEQVWVARRPA